MKNFDKAALGVLLVLPSRCRDDSAWRAGGGSGLGNLPERIAPFQKITLTFSEPVNPQMAEALLDIQPAVDGQIEWLDSRSLTFSPSRPFELAADYRLSSAQAF